MSPRNEWSLAAGGVIVGGFEGKVLPDEVRERLARGELAGVTLFKRNVGDVEQVASLCAAIADAAPPDAPALISIDEEGGRVKRLDPPAVRLPPMRVLGAIDDVDLTRRAGEVLGEALAALGINVDFAPVVDVDSNPANPVIGDRAFAREPERVARHGVAFVQGLQSRGVLACAKHFPGHGDTHQDSHLELPRVTHDRGRIDALEIPPFRATIAAGVASVMTAHVIYDALDPDRPATLSYRVVTDLLRNELDFTGVCFSDDLHMKAVSALHPVGECSILAIEAGCDGLLICRDLDSQEQARSAMETRAKESEVFARRLREAADRMLALRRRAPPRPVRDPKALRAILERAEHTRVRDEINARALEVRTPSESLERDPTAR